MYGKRQQAGVDSDDSELANAADRFDDVTSKKQKRQQGWHTMYGKRNKGDVMPRNVKRQQGWEIAYGKRLDEEADDVTKRQHSLYREYGAEIPDIMNKRQPYKFMDKHKLIWHSTPGKHRPDSFMNKRQQGWRTPYGKRNPHFPTFAESLRELFDTKTVDDENIAVLPAPSTISSWSHDLNVPSIVSSGADLASKEPEDWNSHRTKRQQGWHNPYGKRSVGQEPLVVSGSASALGSPFQDPPGNLPSYLVSALYPDIFHKGDVDVDDDFHEGSNFGEDMALDKRQQGWYTPYGKRSFEV